MFLKKRDGETSSSFLFRFNKKIQQSGILREAKKRKFHKRTTSRIKRRLSAIYREQKRKEVERKKKLGLL